MISSLAVARRITPLRCRLPCSSTNPLGSVNSNSVLNAIAVELPPCHVRPGDGNDRQGGSNVQATAYPNLHSSNTISRRSVACPELFEFSAGPCHLAGKQWKRFSRFASSPLSLWKMTEMLLRLAFPSMTSLRQL